MATLAETSLRWLLAGFGAMLALIIAAQFYDGAYKHGYAQCEAWYEDQDESDHWDASNPI